MSKIDNSGVKGLRDNAVFIAGLLVNSYEKLESQILKLLYADQDLTQADNRVLQQKLEELRLSCNDLSLHKSNLLLIKDCIE